MEAGLGTLGTNRLILTNEYGPRVRLLDFLTDAALEVDAKSDVGIAMGVKFAWNSVQCLRYLPM